MIEFSSFEVGNNGQQTVGSQKYDTLLSLQLVILHHFLSLF